MSDNKPLDDTDRAVLAKLDEDFLVAPDGMTASISGNMEATVTRHTDESDESDELFLLRITFPNGEPLEIKILRHRLLQELAQLNIEGKS